MNSIHTKIALVLAILSSSGSILAYTWTFTNVTNRPIIIELRLQLWPYIYYDILNPGENSSRFEWPVWTSIKAGFCLDNFLIGELNQYDMKNIFGKIKRPNASQIKAACNDENTRATLARVGKREILIKWIPDQRWGTFSKATRSAVKILSTSATKLAGTALDVATAAGAEITTGGATGGKAGAAALKLQLGKLFTVLETVPGAVMDLASRTRCAARKFDIIKTRAGQLIAATNDQ